MKYYNIDIMYWKWLICEMKEGKPQWREIIKITEIEKKWNDV